MIDKYKITGKIILSSGEKSDFYYDIKSFMCDPANLFYVKRVFVDFIAKKDIDIDFVGGMEIGSIPLTFALSEQLLANSFIVRKKEKQYGLKGRLICNKDKLKGNILLVEDVISTGNTIKEVLDVIKIKPKMILCVVNRSEINGINRIPIYSII